MILNKDLKGEIKEEAKPDNPSDDANNDVIDPNSEKPSVTQDEKENQENKEKSQKKGLKIKQKAKETKDRDVIVEELQRDILIRDETIKELNLKVVDLQTDIKQLLDHLDDKTPSKKETLWENCKMSTNAKNDLLANLDNVEKMMEESTKTIDEYRSRFDKAQEAIGELRDEIIKKENLLKNKDEVYQRVLDDLQNARKNIGTLQLEKLEIQAKNDQLSLEVSRLKEEGTQLEARLIDAETRKNKEKKQKLLVDELNTRFFGMSVSDLGKEINQNIYNLIVKLRRDNITKMIEGVNSLNAILKEENIQLSDSKLSKYKDKVKENINDDKDNEEESKDRPKSKNDSTPKEKSSKKSKKQRFF